MPRYFKSTANKPGGGVRKGYRRGGRNLRDEEARVIGVQDNAADELRRVRARRPHDAAERRDKRSQLSRVGSRERNARDEMARLRGYQYGGAIGRQAAAMGPAINRQAAQAMARNQALQEINRTRGAGRFPGVGFPTRPPAGIPTSGPRRATGGPVGYQYGGAIARQAAAFRPPINVNPVAIASQLPAFTRGGSHIPKHPGDTRRDRTAAWHRLYGSGGGRLGFKTGGRIPSKKGAKFI